MQASEASKLPDLLRLFSQEVADLSGSRVAELGAIPEASLFRADFVARNRPCVIRGAASTWPAVTKWSLQYLADQAGSLAVTCTFSSGGRADAVKQLPAEAGTHCGERAFVLPHTEKMQLAAFIEHFVRQHHEAHAAVPSVQFQNSNLDEFAGTDVHTDLALDPCWAQEAFSGAQPDASNIWIGDRRSETTFHKVRILSCMHIGLFHRRVCTCRLPATA